MLPWLWAYVTSFSLRRPRDLRQRRDAHLEQIDFPLRYHVSLLCKPLLYPWFHPVPIRCTFRSCSLNDSIRMNQLVDASHLNLNICVDVYKTWNNRSSVQSEDFDRLSKIWPFRSSSLKLSQKKVLAIALLLFAVMALIDQVRCHSHPTRWKIKENTLVELP